jgi:K+-transporting ATPase ATPase C chain
MIVLTGLAYPLLITGICQVVFPHQANGSLIERNGGTVGTSLIGQPFDDPKYFWSRPSATGPSPYNAAASSGSNLAAGNPTQTSLLEVRAKKLRDADPGNTSPIPSDLVTASASGLDPHISVAGARWQSGRVARARGMDVEQVQRLIDSATERRQLGLFGEPRVNVLNLNLSVDAAPAGNSSR